MTYDQNSIGQARRERDAAQEHFEITFDADPAPSMIVRLEDAEVVAINPGLTEVSGRDDDEVKRRSVRTLELFEDEKLGRHGRGGHAGRMDGHDPDAGRVQQE